MATLLPENVDESFADRARPGDKAHQQHHDIIHREVNLLEGRFASLNDRIDSIQSGEIDTVVDEVLIRVEGEVNTVVETAVGDHASSETPHPVYDDGPSFSLLYENAKV